MSFFLLLAAAFFPIPGCALKPGPGAGPSSAGRHGTVSLSLPGEAEGLIQSGLTPSILDGWSLLRAGRYAQAEGRFADALDGGSALSPEDLAAAHSGLGYSRLGQSRPAEAKDAFGLALAERPEYGPARLGLARILRSAGRPDESVEVYDQLFADHPGSAMLKLEEAAARSEAVQLLVRRGEAAEADGDAQAAAAEYRRAAGLAPRTAKLFGLLAGALESGGQYDEALDALVQALALSEGGDADVFRTRLAWLDLEHGRSDRAVASFEALLRNTPGDPALREGLDRAEEKLRQDRLPAEYHRMMEGGPLSRGGLAAIIALEFGWDDDPAGDPGVRLKVIRDTGAHWAEPYIRAVVNREVLELFQNHTFRPEMPLTRGDLASAACRLLRRAGEWAGAEEKVVISDLSRDHRHFDCICRLVGLGLLERFADNTVRINEGATAAEALELVSAIHQRLAGPQP